MTKISNGRNATLQILPSRLRAHQHSFAWRFDNRQQEPRQKGAVIVTRPLDFRWADRVNQQVRVTVDQPGQQGCVAQVDRLSACRRLYPLRRAHLFNFAAFNQHRCR